MGTVLLDECLRFLRFNFDRTYVGDRDVILLITTARPHSRVEREREDKREGKEKKGKKREKILETRVEANAIS